MVRPPVASATTTPLKEIAQKHRATEPLVLHVTLDNPRFAAVNERLRAHDAPGASKAFEDARVAASKDADASQTCAIDFVAGRLHRDAGEDADASRAFDRIAQDCALAPYAALNASQADARLGRTDDAIARAKQVPGDVPIALEARLAEAEARAAKGDRVGALGIWRAHIATNAHGARWVDTSVKIANAVLDGVDGDPRRGGSAEARRCLRGAGGSRSGDRGLACDRSED
jgi:hypothetical protein